MQIALAGIQEAWQAARGADSQLETEAADRLLKT